MITMDRQALIPAAAQATAKQLSYSPGHVVGPFVYVSGVTGSKLDGSMPADAEEQFRRAFEKIAEVLKEIRLGLDALVEMTSYHVGLQTHFETFCGVRSDYLSEPFPAWTAIEVAGLRRLGAIVEIKAIAVALQNS